jgi:hypothetical protein
VSDRRVDRGLELCKRRGLKCLVHGAIRLDALGDLEAQRARNQRRRKADAQVEQVVALLHRDVEHVPKSARDEHGGGRAAPLDDGVGHERGSVHDHRHVGWGNTCLLRHGAHTVEDRLLRRLRRGQRLVRDDFAPRVVEESEVGKRTADVDPDAITHLLACLSLPAVEWSYGAGRSRMSAAVAIVRSTCSVVMPR